MASWPPPPPPPRPGGGFRNNEGHEGTHNGHVNTMNQTEPQFAAPPLRNQSGGSPTDSFAAMRLDGSSLPPPPARTTQGSTLFPPPPRPPGSDSSGPLAQPPEIPRSAHLPRPPAFNGRPGAASATTRGQAPFPPPPPLQGATVPPASLSYAHTPSGRSAQSPVMSGAPSMSASPSSAHNPHAAPPPPVYGASPTTTATASTMSAPHAGPPPMYGTGSSAATTGTMTSAPYAGSPPPVHGASPPTTAAPNTMRPPTPPPMPQSSPPAYPMTTIRPPPPPAMTSQPQPMMNGPPSHHHHQQQQPKPRIDPSQIPRPPLFTRPQNGEPVPIYYTKRMLNGLPPPDADSRFVSCDDGNAAPQLIRSSVYKIPQDRGVWKKTGLPELGLICTPLALPSSDYTVRPRVMPMNEAEEPYTDPQRIPVDYSTLSNNLPPRCSRCQAYANPFWINGSKCNFCGTRNRSISNNMSLQYGTIEYVVGGPYVTRKQPVEPIFLYAIDATCPNVMGYLPLLEQVGVSLGEHVRRQTVDYTNPPRIGIALVGGFGVVVISCDGRVHVMSDVSEEPFCPLPLNEWTYDVSTDEGLQQWMVFSSRLLDYWQPFLDSLDSTSAYGQSSYAISCGGAALAFMADALADSGGR
jgi:protein transport protein SEC24